MKKSTDNDVSCPSAIAAGKVCSHAVLVAQLRSWGIDCELILPHHREPGQSFSKAVQQAWEQGHVRICSLDPATTGRPWLTMTRPSAAAVAEAMALPRAGTRAVA